MNILFVYSFTRLWNTFYEELGSHHPVFAAFRREFANEPVSPLYVFSKTKKSSTLQKSILDEKELLNSFRFTRSLNLVRGDDRQIIRLGMLYEQFYLDIITKESIDCIVNWNLGYGFQHVGHLLAKKRGIKTIVMEGGLFRPYTLTIEPEGVNAFSMMRKWNGMNEIRGQEAATFENFRNIYFADEENKSINTASLTSRPRSPVERFKKEIKQRFVYNYCDAEIYHHHWLKRFFKTALRGVLADRSFVPPIGKRVFTFFLSSVYDSQLEIPTHAAITKYLRAVLDGFQLFRQNHPEYWLLIKEHPLDESRSLFWNLYKQNNTDNVRWTIQSSKRLISLADGIITINSTVGIEALMLEKPVLCLGESCYRHEGITVSCSDSFSVKSVAEALEQLAIFIPDSIKADSFLYDAYEKTQIPFWQSSNEKEEIRQGLISYLKNYSMPVQ